MDTSAEQPQQPHVRTFDIVGVVQTHTSRRSNEEIANMLTESLVFEDFDWDIDIVERSLMAPTDRWMILRIFNDQVTTVETNYECANSPSVWSYYERQYLHDDADGTIIIALNRATGGMHHRTVRTKKEMR